MPNPGGISGNAGGDSGWPWNGSATGRKQQGDGGCKVLHDGLPADQRHEWSYEPIFDDLLVADPVIV
jgi:hypothetical protein